MVSRSGCNRPSLLSAPWTGEQANAQNTKVFGSQGLGVGSVVRGRVHCESGVRGRVFKAWLKGEAVSALRLADRL